MASLFRETVASQYFLELAKYVGLPVIAWNADNAALEKAKDMVSREASDNFQTKSFFVALEPEQCPAPASTNPETSGPGHTGSVRKVNICKVKTFTLYSIEKQLS